MPSHASRDAGHERPCRPQADRTEDPLARGSGPTTLVTKSYCAGNRAQEDSISREPVPSSTVASASCLTRLSTRFSWDERPTESCERASTQEIARGVTGDPVPYRIRSGRCWISGLARGAQQGIGRRSDVRLGRTAGSYCSRCSPSGFSRREHTGEYEQRDCPALAPFGDRRSLGRGGERDGGGSDRAALIEEGTWSTDASETADCW